MTAILLREPAGERRAAERTLWCDACGAGYGHPGDEHLAASAALGNPWAAHLAGEAVPCRLCGRPCAEEVVATIVRMPARVVVRCACGGTVDIQAWAGERTFDCDRCGRAYNAAGQALEPDRALWDGTDGARHPGYR